MRNILYGFFMLLFMIISSCAVRDFKQAVVRGNSMYPLLPPGSQVKIDTEYYKNNPISRGDIVIIKHPGRAVPIIKIVKAVPGDSFELKDTESGVNILINKELLRNSEGIPYSFSGRQEQMLTIYVKDYSGVIPPDSYLVLGDNPSGSLDSTSFGLISSSRIAGRIR